MAAKTYGRRRFLRGVGGVTVGLPFLETFAPRKAAAQMAATPKRLATDERFISYAARDRLRVHSRRIAVKFHWEFMAPWPFLETVRRRLPWVVRRRRGLVAVAFEGDNLKPWRLSAVRPGEIVTHRHLRVRWAYPEFADYWREVPPQGQ